MVIEVDQSGKIENTQTDTVLAYSNGKRQAIIIPASLKRKWFSLMSTQRKTKRETYLLLFSACLYLLLKDVLKKDVDAYIDKEYFGHENDIKAMVLRFFAKSKKSVESSKIHFRNVGKKSTSHKLALEVFRERGKADSTVKEKELFNLLK